MGTTAHSHEPPLPQQGVWTPNPVVFALEKNDRLTGSGHPGPALRQARGCSQNLPLNPSAITYVIRVDRPPASPPLICSCCCEPTSHTGTGEQHCQQWGPGRPGSGPCPAPFHRQLPDASTPPPLPSSQGLCLVYTLVPSGCGHTPPQACRLTQAPHSSAHTGLHVPPPTLPGIHSDIPTPRLTHTHSHRHTHGPSSHQILPLPPAKSRALDWLESPKRQGLGSPHDLVEGRGGHARCHPGSPGRPCLLLRSPGQALPSASHWLHCLFCQAQGR